MVDILIKVENPKNKKQEVKIFQDNKLIDIQEFPEKFWVKAKSLKTFLEFCNKYKETKEEIKVILEKDYKEQLLSMKELKIVVPINLPEKIKKLLTDPNLLQKYNDEFDKRIVKEYSARKTVFIFSLGKLLENCEATSFNLCVSDDSGLGKDYVVENVLLMWEQGEDKDYIKCEKITPEVMDSLSKRVDWHYKIFYNADVRKNVLNSETFKSFSSGATSFYTHQDGVAMLTQIKGKPIMIITTAKGVGIEEIVRRYINCGLIDDVNQTKEIMKKWATFKKDGIKPTYNSLYKEALTYLKPIKVKIPFAEELIDYFPSEHVIMRTQWSRFLDMIAAVTVLYQYQREIDSDGYYLATWGDYDIAVDILESLLSNSKQVPLYKSDKKIMKALEEVGPRVRISTLEAKTHFTPKTLRERLMQMADFGLVDVGEATAEEMGAVYTNKDGNKFDKTFKPTMVFTKKDFALKDLSKSEKIINNIKSNNTNINNNSNNSNNSNNTQKTAKTELEGSETPKSSKGSIVSNVTKISEKNTQQIIDFFKLNSRTKDIKLVAKRCSEFLEVPFDDVMKVITEFQAGDQLQ